MNLALLDSQLPCLLRTIRLQLNQRELLVPVSRVVLCFPVDSFRFILMTRLNAFSKILFVS
jgi:hypothetical protein